MRLTQVDVYEQDGSFRYAGIFRQQAGPAWIAYHNVDTATHQASFDDLVADGFRPIAISTDVVGSTTRWAAVYDQASVGSFIALSGLSEAAYQDLFDQQLDAGRVLAHLDGWDVSGSPRLGAIFTDAGPSVWTATHNQSAAGFQDSFDTWTAAGFSTELVVGYEDGRSANYGGMWVD